MKRIWLNKIVLSLVLLSFSLIVFAQDSAFSVGEKVELYCNCFGPAAWVSASIEQDQGNGNYRVRFGNGRYNYLEAVSSKNIRKVGMTAKIADQNNLREQFRKEAWQYSESVFSLMMIHDENLFVGNGKHTPPVRAEDWKKTMSDLAALDNLCKTKYTAMTNDPNSPWKGDLAHQPATWCEIAANRKNYETKGRQMAAGYQFKPLLDSMLGNVQEVIDNPQVFITEDIQLLMFEREKWRAMQTPKFQKNFTAMGTPMSNDFFAAIEKKADELKAQNEREAPRRSFLMPKQKDAVVEGFIRGRYVSQKKGVEIFKIGLDDATWQIHRNSLGIPLSQTKVARLLVKIPYRPLCQEHSVAVERKYTRGVLGAMVVEGNVGSESLLMSCK